MEKAEIKKREAELIEMTNKFCTEHINEEYAQICTKLIKKMGRKKDVPFAKGQLNIWAAGIIHAVGTVNFLFDDSFEPYTTIDIINDYFGTKKSSSGQKSKIIRDMFNMDCFDFGGEFATKYIENQNPLKNMVMVNDLIVPISMLPENTQELVKKLRANGVKDFTITTKDPE